MGYLKQFIPTAEEIAMVPANKRKEELRIGGTRGVHQGGRLFRVAVLLGGRDVVRGVDGELTRPAADVCAKTAVTASS